MTSLEFSKLLLEEADVAVSPGIGFGEYGEGHVRLALVENRHRLGTNIAPNAIGSEIGSLWKPDIGWGSEISLA